MKGKSKFFDTLAFILVVVGALNWGLVGFFHFDLVATLFGAGSLLSRIVYILVGLSGLWMIYVGMCWCKGNRSCDK